MASVFSFHTEHGTINISRQIDYRISDWCNIEQEEHAVVHQITAWSRLWCTLAAAMIENTYTRIWDRLGGWQCKAMSYWLRMEMSMRTGIPRPAADNASWRIGNEMMLPIYGARLYLTAALKHRALAFRCLYNNNLRLTFPFVSYNVRSKSFGRRLSFAFFCLPQSSIVVVVANKIFLAQDRIFVDAPLITQPFVVVKTTNRLDVAGTLVIRQQFDKIRLQWV